MSLWADLATARIGIWGAGREGMAAWRVLRQQFPGKDLTILCPANEAEHTRTQVDARTTVIGDTITATHLRAFDIIVKSAGISPYSTAAQDAKNSGVRFTSGTALWFSANPTARVIAVTGTKGKSTTSAMIAHLLRAAGQRTALAGNIGLPLLELFDTPQTPDWWVIELSSYQTIDLPHAPEISIVLNLYPEHLDWHGDEQTYYRDKMNLLHAGGTHPRVNIISAVQTYPQSSLPKTGVQKFGDPSGWHVAAEHIYRGNQRIIALADTPLHGTHNALNFCAALTAIEAAGFDATALAPHIKTFRTLPHRLQPLGFKNDIEYVNDSIATTPYASLAALSYYAGRNVTLLVGGHDRGLDWSTFCTAILESPPHTIITMGANGARIANLLRQHPTLTTRTHEATTLAEAMTLAHQHTPANGLVLLSPGAPSFGEFRDYTERGYTFARLAGFNPELTTISGLGIA